MYCLLVVTPATAFDDYIKKQKKTNDLAWVFFLFWFPLSMIFIGPVALHNEGLSH